MQIGSGASPLTLAVLKTLGNQADLGAPAGSSSTPAASAPATLGGVSAALPAAISNGVSNAVSPSAGSAQNAAAGPPEPGKVFPRGSFVDLKA